jgi:aconitate hydratase 2/2-methylisocitrate dehydratase
MVHEPSGSAAILTITVFKVPGETNTDDLSPAPDATTRPDIPLHALAMLKNARRRRVPAGRRRQAWPDQVHRVAEGQGPPGRLRRRRGRYRLRRKSATNSVLWFTGEDIPFVPNKRFGGVCLGSKIAPIFYNTMEDAGALPIELDVSKMEMGDVIELRPYEGKALKNGAVIAEFKVKSDVLFDEVRAGGRIPLIIGRGLTAKAREALGLPRRRCSACRRTRPTPARASRWRRRWSAAPAACRKARASARAPTANRR